MTKSKFSAFSPYYFHVFSTFSPHFFNSAFSPHLLCGDPQKVAEKMRNSAKDAEIWGTGAQRIKLIVTHVTVTLFMQSVHILSHTYSMLHGINLLWPSDARWRHRSWSTLAQAHYLNQCSLFFRMVLWNSTGSNFTATAQATILCNAFWKLHF